jgi:hypothetical protein
VSDPILVLNIDDTASSKELFRDGSTAACPFPVPFETEVIYDREEMIGQR